MEHLNDILRPRGVRASKLGLSYVDELFPDLKDHPYVVLHKNVSDRIKASLPILHNDTAACLRFLARGTSRTTRSTKEASTSTRRVMRRAFNFKDYLHSAGNTYKSVMFFRTRRQRFASGVFVRQLRIGRHRRYNETELAKRRGVVFATEKNGCVVSQQDC